MTIFADVSRINVGAIASSIEAGHWILPRGIEPPNRVDPTWFRSSMDLESLQVADQFLAELIGAVRAESPVDADDLAVARFELAVSVAPILQRWDALAAAHAIGTTRLLWILERDTPPRLASVNRFRKSLPGIGIDILKVGPRSPGRFIRERLDPTRRRLNRYASRRLARRASIDGGPFLFVEFFPNNLKATWPVAQALVEGGASVAWVATRPVVSARLAEYPGQQQVVDLKEQPWISSPRDRHLEDAVAGLFSRDGDPRDTRPWLVNTVASVVRRHIAQARGWRQTFEDLFSGREIPSVVTSTPYEVSARAAVAVAKQNGVPSAFLQHGAYGERWGHRYIEHDLLLVWGDYEASSLRRLTQSRVEVIGSTVHDELIRARTTPSPSFNEPPLKLIYLASHSGWHFSYSEADKLAGVIREAADTLGVEAEWIYKLHPHDATGVQERAVAGHPRISCTRHGDSREMTRDADIVIVRDSTAGYEACVLGLPLVELDVGHRVQPVFYADSGAALSASSAGELVSAVRTIASSPKIRNSLELGRRNFLRDMLGGGVEGASERAATHLLDLARNS